MSARIFLILGCFFLMKANGFAQSSELNYLQNRAIIFSIGAANVDNRSPLIYNSRVPQFSLRYRKYRENLHFNQWSINNFWTKRFTTSEFNVKSFQIGLEYSYGAKVLRLGNAAALYLGGTAGLEYFSSDATPNKANLFRTQRKHYSILTGGFAEMQFFLFDNWICYLHLPIGVFQFFVDTHEVDNPTIPERQRNQGGFNVDLKYNVGIEFGVGYRF